MRVRSGITFLTLVIAAGIAAFFLYQGIVSYFGENLAKFYTLTKEDPLILPAGIDSSKLEDAVEFLGAVEKSTGSLLRKDSFHIFPMRFLRTLPVAAEAADVFFKKPSLWSAYKLIKAQNESARFYLEDAILLKNEFIASASLLGIPMDQPYVYLTQHTMVTPELLLKDFDLIIKNGQKLIEDAKSRQQCFLMGRCQIARRVLWPEDQSAKFQEVSILPQRVLFPYRKYIKEINGPYLVATRCFGASKNFEPLYQPFYLVKSDLDGFDFWYPKLASDIYYTKIMTERLKGNPLFVDYLEANLSWQSHGEAPYRCNDLSYLFRLHGIDWFKRILKSQGPLVNSLKPEVEKFLQARYPSYSQALMLAKLYEKALQEEKLPPETKASIEELVSGLKTEVVGIEKIFAMIALYEAELNDELQTAPDQIPENYIRISRTYPSTFFLVHSPLIWRIREQPQLSLPVPSSHPPPTLLTTFRQLLKSVPENEIIDETRKKQEISAVYFLRALERFRNISGR